jgi:hypothetical protein
MAQADIDVGLDGVAQDYRPETGRASRSSMTRTGTTLASEHGRRTLTGITL